MADTEQDVVVEEAKQKPQGKRGGGKNARWLKELASLAPWNWDSRLSTNPTGASGRRDFQLVSFACGNISTDEDRCTSFVAFSVSLVPWRFTYFSSSTNNILA